VHVSGNLVPCLNRNRSRLARRAQEAVRDGSCPRYRSDNFVVEPVDGDTLPAWGIVPCISNGARPRMRSCMAISADHFIGMHRPTALALGPA